RFRRATSRSRTAQREQGNFRRYTETNWSANSAQSAIYVDRRVRTLQRRSVQEFLRGDCLRRSKQRTDIEPSHIVGDKTRGTEAVVENFDLNLTTVCMTSKRKLDAQFGGAIERVRIVRKKDVGNIVADQCLHTGKRRNPAAAGIAFTLIIDTN